MGGYKHIEKSIGAYVAAQYHNAVEIGIGQNTDAARVLFDAGIRVRATDIRNFPQPDWLTFFVDDVFAPDTAEVLMAYGFGELNLHRIWAEIYDIDAPKTKF